jgi:hypothetical protein
MSHFRIVLSCSGVPASAGPKAAQDIAKEFGQYHPWHRDVQCIWDGSKLVLSATNDYDDDGSALSDEFSDSISACIAEPFGGDLKIERVEKLPDTA